MNLCTSGVQSRNADFLSAFIKTSHSVIGDIFFKIKNFHMHITNEISNAFNNSRTLSTAQLDDFIKSL